MERPSSNEEIQLVAVLRYLKKTQDEVAEILRMRKERVVSIEHWLKTASLELVGGIIDDYRLKRVIENKLLKRFEEDEEESLGERHVEPVDLVRAAQVTADEILQHYRTDYSLTAKPSMEEGLALAPAISRLYQEHQNGMIHLVERLITELELHLSGFPVRNLGGLGMQWDRSTARRPSLAWQVGKGGSVCLCYGLEVTEDRETRIMLHYLEQHLRSSSYPWLLEDQEKGVKRWKRLGGEELNYRARLLRKIDRAVGKLTDKPLADTSRIRDAGPSTWFSDSIWGAVLDGLYRALEYKVEPIDGGLFSIRYGATVIGLTATREQGGQYVKWHEELMDKFKRSRTVAAVNELKEIRESLTKEIQETLAKFIVDRHIPGKCDYEFCRAHQ